MCADLSDMPNKTGSLSGKCTQFIILTFGSLSHLLFDSQQMNEKINFRILYEFHRQPELTGETPRGGSCGPSAGRRMEIEKKWAF